MEPSTLIIFDGDDTLWLTEPLYDAARASVARYIRKQGLDSAAWEAAERKLDLERVEKLGYAWFRFPSSCALAALRTSGAIKLSTRARVAVGAFARAMTVFADQPQLVPHAAETLKKLQNDSTLALLTKGQRWVQTRRINQSGLGALFDATLIVPKKSKDVFSSFASSLGSFDHVISVGNSLPSDIQPAVDAGFRAVWIDKDVWLHERSEKIPDKNIGVATDLLEVPALVGECRFPIHTTIACVA